MYGKTHHQKQRFRCKDCNRQFVVDNGHLISKEKRGYIERLLSERVSLRGICRSMEVSMTWLMNFAASIWEQTPDNLGVDYELLENLSDEELQSVEIQLDEMWSFVGCKKNKRWIWVVYCPAIKQVLAFHVGGRGKADAEKMLDKLPQRLRDHCQFATDYWEAYYQTIPSDQHHPSKALTFFIEGYFTGVRARVSRLVRRSVAFSKKLENHVAAIGYFLWQRNLMAHHYY
ncbi:IS1 family transposase [Lewinella lacunae]|uniref:IS1 family transposase n=5 Tax=Neolewinella lacunae TaxID=1517758 RepID=A0A923TCK8_9BACT|nr:IS1 family transposase [Neolewinella lacunae]MBC6993839.1 IS1 family transposase [Neolewinella lacunae]MBC6996473.1 IS1 family transposase [Neolewinella lacunae]